MRKLQILWPWSKVRNGQGFFVPCLDPEAVKMEGLTSALHHRIFNAGASIGIQRGLIGVIFYRRPVPNFLLRS